MTAEYEHARGTSYRSSLYQLARVFGPLFVVPVLGLVLWWPPPSTVTVAAIVLIAGSVAGTLLGVGLRVDVEARVVRVRTALGTKEFPAGESTARAESMSSFFGLRRLRFLVLERRGGTQYSARIPMNEFSPAERDRMIEGARATMRGS